MKTSSDRIWSVVRLVLAIAFGAQTMLVPGLHRHPEGSHASMANSPGSSGIVGACAEVVGHDARLGVCASPEPGQHGNAVDCPACMFLKNFQGGAGLVRIPIPVLSPGSQALLREDPRYTSHTVVSALPRGPPTT
jgi:hypothetical protein